MVLGAMQFGSRSGILFDLRPGVWPIQEMDLKGRNGGCDRMPAWRPSCTD